jgi:hypothetical protein
MATFNAELASKALERRLAGLESAIDAIQKQSRATGDPQAAVLALQKQAAEQKQKFDSLEKIVKTLMETRGESKEAALQKLRLTVEALEKQQRFDHAEMLRQQSAEASAREKLGMHEVLRKPDVERLIYDEVTKAREALSGLQKAEALRAKTESDRKAEASIAEQERREKALVEQAMKDSREQAAKMIAEGTKIAVDTQLKILTARLIAVEARLKG